MHSTGLTALVAALSACAGVALTLWVSGDRVTEPQVVAVDGGELTELSNRVAQLESALQEISAAATILDTELTEELPAAAPRAGVAQPAPATREERASAWRRSQEGREQRERELLLAAGWTQPEVDQVRQIGQVSRLQALEDQHRQARALREKYPELMDLFQARANDPLREALGDEKYADYLNATGRPTAVNVNSVVPGSAGDIAGLRGGDTIMRYDGERVFNFRDLEQATYDGEFGESVTLEVERDGATFHITIPRGPIGTSGRWRN